MKEISTSISTFKNIIEGGYIYVDKTKYIYEMVKQPFGQFFFSRICRKLRMKVMQTV